MRLPDFSVYNDIAQPIFVLSADSTGQVVYAFLNAFGCAAVGQALPEVLGKPASVVFGGRVGQSVQDRQTQAWHAGEATCYDIALSFDDRKVWVRSSLKPVYGADGALAYMVGASHDVTHEHALEQAQAMTSAVVSEMEDFVSLAAHDLRSPIANVQTLVELVCDGFVDMGDGKLEMIGMIEEISTRALSLVSDVMAHAAAAQAGSDMRSFDLQALCNDILVTLDPSSRHNVTMAKLRITADYVVLQIVLRNLIDNAIKHANTDQVALDISLDMAAEGRIAITVCDDGAGFADPALAFLDGGALNVDSGFGLLGVRRLVRARGGDISARLPTSGRGAEIRFELPGQVIQTYLDTDPHMPVAI